MVKITINRNKCEGKAKCIEACPESVLELKKPNPKELSFHARLKLRFHGGKQAFVIQPENCTICLACVKVCPEEAISINEAPKVLQKTKDSKEKLPKSPFPSWLAFVLTSRLRKLRIDPERIIARAGIKKGQAVLEVGCGPGFFTEFIAKEVGLSGKVIAQDIQQPMLGKLKKRMIRFPIKKNIQLLLANSSGIGLPPESIDLVFAANVFEEIAKEGEMSQTARELYRVLRPGGILFFGEHRVPTSLIKNILTELEGAGFEQKGPGENSFFCSALFKKPSLEGGVANEI